MNKFALAKSIPYYDQVYHSIKQMIHEGIFQPGDRIYEAKIARDFNLSRSPIREAIRALEKEGLLVIDEKSRMTVYKPTMKDVEEIYQCRMVLESLAAKLATEHATNRELKEIEGVLVQTKKYLEGKEEPDKEVIISLNARFHDLILQLSKNNRLQKQLSELKALTHYYMLINLKGERRKWIIFAEHQEIFDCMKRRDDENAGQLMSTHIHNDLQHLKQILE
ncbi:GntR family transcriptional regulator [Brevibacillus sp. SIMBA_040]|uniref:GntR family transcriptional regulator n=1 Tax=unclassified Brevibacillus TaxID=2684853 RepID=UPI00397A613D